MKKNLNGKGVLIAMSLVAAFALTGCSGKDVPVNLDQEIQERDERISLLEKEAQRTQDELKKSQREAEAAVRRASAAEAQNSSAANTPVVPANMQGDLLPPNAKAGECYARVLIPPVYETTSERVLAKEASASIKIIPAKYEWVEEKVLVKEASEKLEVVPATYKTESEKVLVKAASTRMVEVPAVYGTESEKVLVTPAREYWKKGRGPVEKVDGATGEIMCLVKEEAVYKTVTKKTLKTPATTREETIPAEYKTITRTVVDRPASTREVMIPAEYATVKVRNLVSPPKEVRTPIDAEYRTVTKQAMVEPSYMEWRQILCETNMNHGTIMDVQKALQAKGFKPGPIDGVYGAQTRNAVHAFQKANKLPTGALTYGTIKALGLSY